MQPGGHQGGVELIHPAVEALDTYGSVFHIRCEYNRWGDLIQRCGGAAQAEALVDYIACDLGGVSEPE
ncbi:MAG: hypothetical protein ACYS76_02120 [Planctomycetota bacterium]